MSGSRCCVFACRKDADRTQDGQSQCSCVAHSAVFVKQHQRHLVFLGEGEHFAFPVAEEELGTEALRRLWLPESKDLEPAHGATASAVSWAPARPRPSVTTSR